MNVRCRIVLIALACTAMPVSAATGRERQQVLYNALYELLDESDIATGSAITRLEQAGTPCQLVLVHGPDAIEGGNAVTLRLNLTKLQTSAVVTAVFIYTFQSVTYYSNIVHIDRKETTGIQVELIDYQVSFRGNRQSVKKVRKPFADPYITLVPRRAIGYLHDQQSSQERDRIAAVKLVGAIKDLADACR
jgi:hypothetical protein